MIKSGSSQNQFYGGRGQKSVPSSWKQLFSRDFGVLFITDKLVDVVTGSSYGATRVCGVLWSEREIDAEDRLMMVLLWKITVLLFLEEIPQCSSVSWETVHPIAGERGLCTFCWCRPGAVGGFRICKGGTVQEPSFHGVREARIGAHQTLKTLPDA